MKRNSILRTTLFPAALLAAAALCLWAPGTADAQRKKKAKPACGLSYLPFAQGMWWEYQWIAPETDTPGLQATMPTKFRVEVKSVEGGKKSATITLIETYRKHSIETQIKCDDSGVRISPQSFFYLGEPGGGLRMSFEGEKREGPDLPAAADFRTGLVWTSFFKAKVVRTPTDGTDAKLSNALLEIFRENKLVGSELINTPIGDFRASRMDVQLSAQAAVEPAVDKWVPLPQGNATMYYASKTGVVKVVNRFGHGWELINTDETAAAAEAAKQQQQ